MGYSHILLFESRPLAILATKASCHDGSFCVSEWLHLWMHRNWHKVYKYKVTGVKLFLVKSIKQYLLRNSNAKAVVAKSWSTVNYYCAYTVHQQITANIICTYQIMLNRIAQQKKIVLWLGTSVCCRSNEDSIMDHWVEAASSLTRTACPAYGTVSRPV